MGKESHFGDKINTEGFSKNPQNINKNGAPVSIRREVKEILLANGEISIPKKDLVSETTDSYIFKVPTQEVLASKLISIAIGKGAKSFDAIKLLLETFDGKAKQHHDITTKGQSINDKYDSMTDDELEQENMKFNKHYNN